MRYYEIHLGDEALQIGSGRRYVLATEGRKWAWLVSPSLRASRLPLGKWRSLPKRELDLTPQTRRRLRSRMRKWSSCRPRTRLVKRAEKAVAR